MEPNLNEFVMDSTPLFASLTIAVTILLFMVGNYKMNLRWKNKEVIRQKEFQEAHALKYMEFQTATNIKLAEFEKDLCELRDRIQNNRTEIIQSTEKYKNITLEATNKFRDEVFAKMKDNKAEHAEIGKILLKLTDDTAYIRGKIGSRSLNK